MKFENIKAVIFDLDGTLADTIPGIRNAVNRVRAEYGLAPISSEETQKGLNHGIANLMDVTVATELGDRSPEMLGRLTTQYVEELELTFNDEVEPYPGMPDAVAELRRRGYRVAVLSNKPDRFVKPQINTLYGEGTIRVRRGVVDVNIRKPDPALTHEMLDELGEGILPSECVMVGDSDVDIHTARNAGMKALSVSWGYRDREFLLSCEPDAIVDSAEELLSLFE